MLLAFVRAIAELFTPALRRIVAISLAVAAASFILLWLLVGVVLTYARFFEWRALDWLVDLLGAVATLLLSWLLFPAVVTIVMGFFLDRVAAAVEARHYPGLPPARRALLAETIATTLRLMGITLLLNILALPIYVLLPGLNFFVFLGLNGYLFGREYFEVVALRRLDPTAVRIFRYRHAGRVFLAGTVIASLFAVPVVNLLVPLVATAFMVHFIEGLRRIEPQLLAS